MVNRLPFVSFKRKIRIICEGHEEYYYLDRLIKLNIWNSQYEVSLENAEGNGNISARYENDLKLDYYDVVLIYCDTDRNPHDRYENIKSRVNNCPGPGRNIADEVVIFGNPCTMQIIIKHWTDENVRSASKRRNADLIRRCTGVENYDAHIPQIESIMSQITVKNYADMRRRVGLLSRIDTEPGSTNFGMLLERLTSDDSSWIDKINARIYSETEEFL